MSYLIIPEKYKPLMSMQQIHSIVLSGGSAFGLGAANGAAVLSLPYHLPPFCCALRSVRTGACAAFRKPASMPLASIELPPCEINGIVTPVNGITLQEPKILSAICTMNAAATPTASPE